MYAPLQSLLESYRAQRAFDVDAYLAARLRLLNDYFRKAGIRAAVVGVSGGIDSAVVLGLLVRAAALPGSPLRRVVPALIPMFVEAGASNQDRALERGQEVAAAFGLEGVLVDLSASLQTIKGAVDQGYGRAGEPWAAGQLVSYLRTPALYYLAALLNEDGLPAVLLGTTNRDEGSYIGFFGKASDGMVDVQPISDLHKSEVRALARRLGVPGSVMEAIPSGDTYDACPDERMIGAPYEFLELYEHWLCAGKPPLEWSGPTLTQWTTWAAALEELHRKNLHKYLASSVAVHLDILQRPVPGGWRSEVYTPWAHGPSPKGRLVGEFELSTLPGTPPPVPGCRKELDFGDACLSLDDVLSADECAQLYREVLEQTQIPVGIHGRTSDCDPSLGSTRASAYSPAWADELWRRLAPVVPQVRIFDELSSTDHGGHPVWRAVGINPVLRFICYRQGGHLVPHYDAGFDFGDGRRFTLMSVIVYLNTLPAGAGGQTRFLRDAQRGLPVAERDHRDWESLARPGDVLLGVSPLAGRVLIFDHRLLHDAEAWTGDEPRLLLRTDMIFERCGLQPQEIAPSASAAWQGSPKLQADPFYGPLASVLGVNGAMEAGYFEDSRPNLEPDPRADCDWLCTPVFKARYNLPQDGQQPLAVLLTTGALCPVHPGHLAMLEEARRALQGQGVCVIGGYLSPSHDEYVLAKCGDQVPSAAHRLHLCRQAVVDSDWLMVDEWEALHTSAALNFSEVIERLQRYLNRHLGCARPIRVYYVFGSDNARFALTFGLRGQAVCVERPGFSDRLETFASHPLLADNPRVLFLRGGELPDLASTRVRQGDFGVLTPPVRALWQDWQVTQPGSRPARLFLRDEGEWAVQHWVERLGSEPLRVACRRFMSGVGEAVQQGFREARLPDPPSPLDLCVLSIQDQRQLTLQRAHGADILSLDPCMPGAFNLGVSRCFELCANEIRPGLVARPGWPALEEQLAAIPAGDYWLVDDDIATGHTMKEVIARLPQHVRIEHQEALCQLPDMRQSGLVDLGDFRDFLLGSWEGGLVVALPNGQLARVPYLLPYVNPADRLSLPISQSFAFSRRVWQLNLEFFQTFPLTVGDTPPAFRQLADYLGLSSSHSLAEWCQWHLLRMTEAP